MSKYLRDFVNGMEKIGEALDKAPIPTKIGTKVGVLIGMSPVGTPIAIGGAVVYGAYKAAKYVVDKEDEK